MPSQLDSLRHWTPAGPGRLSSDIPCPVVAVSSGKGGVGKSNLSLSIALALADLGGRILLIDGDMGLANLHILCGLHPERTVDDVLEGRCGPEDALLAVDPGVDLLPAASGIANLAALGTSKVGELARSLARLQTRYHLAIVDTGAGIGDTTLNLALAADKLLMVTTPEPTAQADAYAMFKVLRARRRDLSASLCVNMVADEEEARRSWTRLAQVCTRFLGWEPAWGGWVPRQPGLERHVLERRPAFRAQPDSGFAREIRGLARQLVDGLDSRGDFFARLAATSPRDAS